MRDSATTPHSPPRSLLPPLRRVRLGSLLSLVGAFLLHCRWVLLNGASVPYRIWTVLGASLLLPSPYALVGPS